MEAYTGRDLMARACVPRHRCGDAREVHPHEEPGERNVLLVRHRTHALAHDSELGRRVIWVLHRGPLVREENGHVAIQVERFHLGNRVQNLQPAFIATLFVGHQTWQVDENGCGHERQGCMK